MLTDRCTRSQRWSRVTMATVWAEGAVSTLTMQKLAPLRSVSGFKMAVREREGERSDQAIICSDDDTKRGATEGL